MSEWTKIYAHVSLSICLPTRVSQTVHSGFSVNVMEKTKWFTSNLIHTHNGMSSAIAKILKQPIYINLDRYGGIMLNKLNQIKTTLYVIIARKWNLKSQTNEEI